MTLDRCASRRHELVSILQEEGLDGLIVTHLPNIRYLTGFSGSAGVLVVSKPEIVLFTDSRYRSQVKMEVDNSVRVEAVTGDIWRRVWEVLGGTPDVERLGYEARAVSAFLAAGFSPINERTSLEQTGSLVEQLRARKSPEEVQSIAEAARLATEALERALAQVKAGLTELEVAGLLEKELRVGGSEWHPFPTIVASGPRSALPHALTSTRTISAGELLLLDFGAQVDGYCADISRTVVVGRCTEERQRSIYELVRDTQQVACKSVRAGMTGCEADALARSRIEAGGYGEYFEHSLGHGLGLEVHEEPRLSKLNESKLPVGSVVTIEPGVYLPGWGGIRIEDDICLSEEGPVLLSDGNTEFREIT